MTVALAIETADVCDALYTAHSSPRCEGFLPPTTQGILQQPHSKRSLLGTAFFMRRVFIHPPVVPHRRRRACGCASDMIVRKLRSGFCLRIHFRNGCNVNAPRRASIES